MTNTIIETIELMSFGNEIAFTTIAVILAIVATYIIVKLGVVIGVTASEGLSYLFIKTVEAAMNLTLIILVFVAEFLTKTFLPILFETIMKVLVNLHNALFCKAV